MGVTCRYSIAFKLWQSYVNVATNQKIESCCVNIWLSLKSTKIWKYRQEEKLNFHFILSRDPKIRFPYGCTVGMCHHLWDLVPYTKSSIQVSLMQIYKNNDVLNCTLKQRRNDKLLHTGHFTVSPTQTAAKHRNTKRLKGQPNCTETN